MLVSHKYISEKELRTHNKIDDLWISIHGKVYDVTNWLKHHPGGTRPLMYLGGQEVTDAFLAYHPISSFKHLEPLFTGCYIENYKVSEMSQDYRKLVSEFQKMGLFLKKGHSMLVLMFITILMLFASVYGVLTSNSKYVHLLCAALMGFSWIQTGWIMHDSGHYQTMINPKWNRIALFVVSNCLSGIGGVGWKMQHNTHHISTNSLEFDPDTHFMPIFVFSSEYFTSLTSNYYKKKLHFGALARFFISHQDVTYFVFMAFGRLFAYSQALSYLLLSKKTPNKCIELSGLLVFWFWYLMLLKCLPDWFERITFVLIALAVCGIQAFQFTLSHVSCDVYVGSPSGKDWVKKQLIGSLNIKCSPWMDWFYGGLHFQIEHHLFPRMPRCQLRKISPFINDLCRKHNLPYNCASSFWEASVSTISTVRGVALEARDSVYPISEE